MEPSARQAVRLRPDALAPLYESMYGPDGFLTRQKEIRQMEKETIYTNMFGDDRDSGSKDRQIMLRSRFRRAPVVTPENKSAAASSWSAKSTPYKVRKAVKTTRKQKSCASNSYSNLRGLCLDCSQFKSVPTGKHGFNGDREVNTHGFGEEDYADTGHSHDNEPALLSTSIMPREQKRPAECERCSIVTVCGLCTDCSRLQNINKTGSIFQPQQAGDTDPSRKARLIHYIQSSLKISLQIGCPAEGATSWGKVKVKFDNSSYDYMERLWQERDHPYLFGDTVLRRPDSFIVGMDASPRRDNQREYEEAARANDGGGPTRQFLSMFWRYLPSITVTNNHEKLRIFEETDSYLRPLCDERIYRLMEDYYKLQETSIYRSYRALGRMIGFCILHHYHISNNVLSRIHRNYLFRGVSPKETYDISDLIHDLKDNMGRHLDYESNNEEEFEKNLRHYAYENYIEQNMIFLEAVREGMRLDFMSAGAIPETFNPIHPSLLQELFFGQAELDEEDLIAALQPVYADENENLDPDSPLTRYRLAIQKQVLRKNSSLSKPEGAFVNVLRSLSRNSKDFLPTFIQYVTGYDFCRALKRSI